jgi:nucleoside-diphosphate-sugar epimerase
MSIVVTVVGARGFVGSAFVRHLAGLGLEVREVTRDNESSHAGFHSHVVIDAAGNSTKYLADVRPAEDFERTVQHRLRTVLRFPADLHLHLSSVDVYPDLARAESTGELTPFEPTRSSRYGFHKFLAEQIVRHYAPQWLIVRLAGMVGPGLRKNPVYDVLSAKPLRIHPDSRYQFLHTDTAARLTWQLVQQGARNAIFNVCGRGLVSPREVAALAGVEMDLSLLDTKAVPRVVDVDVTALQRLHTVPSSREAIEDFVARWPAGAMARP